LGARMLCVACFWLVAMMVVFFFSSRRRHTRSYGDWSSDVCSSDLGLGERGNDGVAGRIKQTPGSVGYVELAYVKQNGLTAALLRSEERRVGKECRAWSPSGR